MKPFTRRNLTLVILGLAIAAAGTFLRLYPLFHNTSNTASEQAAMMVIANLRQTVATSVQKHNPNLTPAQQNQLIKKQFDEILRTEGGKAREAMARLAQQLDRQNKTHNIKPPYLLESDSFYHYSLTQSILERGNLGGPRRGSKYLNPLMLNPEGHWEPFTLHPFIGALIYKTLALFNPSLPLVTAVSWTPVVISVLCLTAFIFLCAQLGCAWPAVMVSGVYFYTAEMFLKRSTFGWYDTDPYNVLFPLLILSAVIPVLRPSTTQKRAWLSSTLSVLIVALYALFWQGWMLIYSLIAGATSLILGINLLALKDKTSSRPLALFLAVFVLGTLAGISVLFGPKDFFALFQEGWTALQGFMHPRVKLWPDLYIAVGELRKAPLGFVIESTGGLVPFIIATAAAVILIPLNWIHRKKEELYILLLLTLFLAVTAALSLGAQRFALLCQVPVSLLCAIGLDRCLRWLGHRAQPLLNKTPLPAGAFTILTALLCLAAAVPPLRAASAKMPSLLNQIYNDTWDEALRQIRERTPPDSVVNTWWPPGHFIKTMAQRRVTFDGATIQQPQAFWLARALIINDERTSLGILRMLNNSANQAADELTRGGLKLSDAVDLLLAIAPLDSTAARQRLEQKLSTDKTDRVLKLTHAPPPPSYLMIYNEMIESNIQFSFVGKWDFRKVEALSRLPASGGKIPKPGTPEYIHFLWEIAGGQPRYSGTFAPLSVTADQVIFEHNVVVDMPTMTCSINSRQFGRGIPASLIFLDGETIVEKPLPGANLSYSVIFVNRGSGSRCALMDPSLARSLLMKLYFFEGKGLNFLKPFYQNHDLTGRTQIQIYEIDWADFPK